MTNNILEIIKDKGISIKRLSEGLKMDYSATHKLVTRENLGTTQLETVTKVAEYLNVDIEKLYTRKGASEMTAAEKVIMINEYMQEVYPEEIDHMESYSRGYILAYENARDYIEALQSSTGENYNFDNTTSHFNEIVRKHYSGGADLIHSTESILIAIESIDGPTLSLYEVTANDFSELYKQMTEGATGRYPGEDEDDEPHYPSIWIDAAIKNNIGSMASLNKYRELNGFEKEI